MTRCGVLLSGLVALAACATGKQRTIDETACAIAVSNLTPHALEIRIGDRRLGTTSIGSINPGELLNYELPCSRGGIWVSGIAIPSQVGAPVSFQSVQSWAELVKGERVEVALHWP
jgi:hypothetical protein